MEKTSKKGEGEKKGRYSMDCREGGDGCSLLIEGSYDEVLDTGTLHSIRAHGMEGAEEKVREDLKGSIKESSGSFDSVKEDVRSEEEVSDESATRRGGDFGEKGYQSPPA